MFNDFQVKELSLIGSRRVDAAPEGNPYDPWVILRERKLFLQLVAKGLLQLRPLVTHRFPLAEAPAAYELLRSRAPEALGVLFTY